jgi:hypothetical protein
MSNLEAPLFDAFYVVLLIPFFRRFMCLFAVVGLGFKYFVTNSSLRLGHPLRKPHWIAFMREEISGLHSDWCANLTVLAWVCTECVKVAISAGCEHVLLPNGIRAKGGHGAQAKQGSACGRDSPGAVHGPPWYAFCVIAPGVMGNVHKSVLGSLEPVKITFPFYIT